MAIEDEAAVAAPATEVVKPEAVKEDVATAESDKAPEAEADKEEPEKVEDPEKPKSKREDRFREMRSRAETAEMRALAEARRADTLAKQNEKLREVIGSSEDFDAKNRAEIRLALNENELDRIKDTYKNAREERMSAKYSMFESRIPDAAERIPELHSVLSAPDFEQRATITPHGLEYILESDRGPDIAFHLYKNPSEGLRIAALPPALQGRELARIEHALISKPNVKKHSTAPAPPPTVGGSKAPAAKDPNSMSMEEYSAWYKNRARA